MAPAPEGQRQPLVEGLRLEMRLQPRIDLAQMEGTCIDLHRAGIQAAQVEQPVEQMIERLDRAGQLAERLVQAGIAVAQLQRRGEQHQRMQRLAQVMAGRGEEAGARPGRGLGHRPSLLGGLLLGRQLGHQQRGAVAQHLLGQEEPAVMQPEQRRAQQQHRHQPGPPRIERRHQHRRQHRQTRQPGLEPGTAQRHGGRAQAEQRDRHQQRQPQRIIRPRQQPGGCQPPGQHPRQPQPADPRHQRAGVHRCGHEHADPAPRIRTGSPRTDRSSGRRPAPPGCARSPRGCAAPRPHGP